MPDSIELLPKNYAWIFLKIFFELTSKFAPPDRADSVQGYLSKGRMTLIVFGLSKIGDPNNMPLC